MVFIKSLSLNRCHTDTRVIFDYCNFTAKSYDLKPSARFKRVEYKKVIEHKMPPNADEQFSKKIRGKT